MISDLANYLQVDEDKKNLINEILFPKEYLKASMDSLDYDFDESELRQLKRPTKYCPKCFKKFDNDENFCYDCLCSLKYLNDMKNIRDIPTSPVFLFKGTNDYNSFEEIFTSQNIDKINNFKFSIVDFRKIIKNIKKTALMNMDDVVKTNEIHIDGLNANDKVLLFAKSFVSVDFKSYGEKLGYFEFNKITVDDRLVPSLLLTTLIHELSHFLLKEILTQIICKLLDCTKNTLIESIITFILSYSPFTCLIDEYAAHTVEGRFTVFGYQDYSSFLDIERSLDGEMNRDEIEITKSIGNTFAISIKDILESFLDYDLRRNIKDQFLKDNFDKPNYEMLLLENCNNLNDEGFMKAIWLILSDGFKIAGSNQDTLAEYNKCF